MSMDSTFGRLLLQQIIPDVRDAGKRVMKDAWVWHFHKDHWEFHGPDDFYWYGSAGTAYEARYKGWSAWLNKRKADALSPEDKAVLDATGHLPEDF